MLGVCSKPPRALAVRANVTVLRNTGLRAESLSQPITSTVKCSAVVSIAPLLFPSKAVPAKQHMPVLEAIYERSKKKKKKKQVLQ